jgi:hypothetical protein
VRLAVSTEMRANDAGEVAGFSDRRIDDKVVRDSDVDELRAACRHSSGSVCAVCFSDGHGVGRAADADPADRGVVLRLLPALLRNGTAHEVVLHEDVRTLRRCVNERVHSEPQPTLAEQVLQSTRQRGLARARSAIEQKNLRASDVHTVAPLALLSP